MDGQLGLGHALALALLHERWAAADRERQAREVTRPGVPLVARVMAAVAGRRARSTRFVLTDGHDALFGLLAAHNVAMPR
jgi:hypothetical protein